MALVLREIHAIQSQIQGHVLPWHIKGFVTATHPQNLPTRLVRHTITLKAWLGPNTNKFEVRSKLNQTRIFESRILRACPTHQVKIRRPWEARELGETLPMRNNEKTCQDQLQQPDFSAVGSLHAEALLKFFTVEHSTQQPASSCCLMRHDETRGMQWKIDSARSTFKTN